jgi:uncharacterized membrane protein
MQNTDTKTALGLDTNVGALICYIGNFLCSFGLIYSIIVVVNDKTNRLVRFHAFQSILCSVIATIIAVIGVIGASIAMIVDAAIGFPLVSLILGLILLVIGGGLLIMFFFAAFKAYKGEFYKIPFIGNFAESLA